jgi:hypothetical protein
MYMAEVIGGASARHRRRWEAGLGGGFLPLCFSLQILLLASFRLGDPARRRSAGRQQPHRRRRVAGG